MDWGDVPAWVAISASGGAIWISLKARGDGKRSADASERSADSAAESVRVARDSLALQQELADEGRAARVPAVRLVVEHVRGSRYRLRNAGDAVAEDVHILSPGDRPYVFEWTHDGTMLAPDESRELRMAAGSGRPIPHQLSVMWGGQEPVPVAVPPTR